MPKLSRRPGLRVGVQRNFVDLMQPKFFDQHGDHSGIRFLQRNFHFEFVGLGILPFGRKDFSLLVSQITSLTQQASATADGACLRGRR